jgi:beta-lactam-binding protein with PASTA domain/predicted Ser/Thr protein kinase
MVESGTLIDGRYEVLSRIGSGGMGNVYLARDQLLGRQVAVKLLHHRFAEDQEFVERFRREASSAAGLSHPNVVAVFDRGEWDGTYYIAMEYLPGRSLKTIVREQGPVDPGLAIDIVIQILRAARFAHRRGIIHRDLTPHNVILDEEGRAKVTDFGIARAGASDMTLTGSIMGTAQYLSPEQAQGHAVNASSDLYAVGIVLYELLTGSVPFDGETAVTIALKQVSAVPVPPSRLNPVVSADLDAVVLRALAKDPAERFADAEEFIEALQQVAQGSPYVPGSGGEARRASASDGSSPSGPLLLAPAGHDEGDPGAGSRQGWLWAVGLVVLALVVAGLVVLLAGSGKVTVPPVVGQSQARAMSRLRSAGLTPGASPVASSAVAIGEVVSQSPTGGSKVAKHSRVSIAVSSGPGSSPLPDVVGAKSAQALRTLQVAGFRPTAQPEPSATVATGVVISTDPSPGTEVQAGSPVAVAVSSGAARVHVPKLTGVSEAEAKAALAAAGLLSGTTTPQTSASQSPGTVLSQSPAAEAVVRAGQKVNLVVARAPKDVVVPSVVGETEAEAAGELGQAGFKPSAVSRAVTSSAQEGVVLQQSPAAGRRAPRGATVTITVGTLGQQTTPSTSSTTTTPPPVSSTSTPTTSTPPPAAAG